MPRGVTKPGHIPASHRNDNPFLLHLAPMERSGGGSGRTQGVDAVPRAPTFISNVKLLPISPFAVMKPMCLALCMYIGNASGR